MRLFISSATLSSISTFCLAPGINSLLSIYLDHIKAYHTFSGWPHIVFLVKHHKILLSTIKLLDKSSKIGIVWLSDINLAIRWIFSNYPQSS